MENAVDSVSHGPSCGIYTDPARLKGIRTLPWVTPVARANGSDVSAGFSSNLTLANAETSGSIAGSHAYVAVAVASAVAVPEMPNWRVEDATEVKRRILLIATH